LKEKVYRAALIGCGQIGACFDWPDSKNIITHAKAYFRHPRTRLVGVMDIEADAAKMAGEKWRCNSYNDIDTLFDEEQPEIISICAPDEYHYEYLMDVIRFRPKAAIAEKPLTKEVESSRRIIAEYAKAELPLFVNYSRRYDETVQEVKGMIDKGEFGRILHVSIKYTKGILHNGSHAVDIANYLFGDILSVETLSGICNHNESDPTLSAYLSYEKCRDVFLMACDAQSYSVFELDILGQKKRIYFDEFGWKYTEYVVEDSSLYHGYRELCRGEHRNTGLGTAMMNLIKNVVNHLERKEEILCMGKDALRAQEICGDLLKSYLEKRKDA